MVQIKAVVVNSTRHERMIRILRPTIFSEITLINDELTILKFDNRVIYGVPVTTLCTVD